MVERQDSETPELDGPSAERGVRASGLILAPWERAFDRILTPFEEFIHRQTTGGRVLMDATRVCGHVPRYVRTFKFNTANESIDAVTRC